MPGPNDDDIWSTAVGEGDESADHRSTKDDFRPPEPTLPILSTPGVDWEPTPVASPPEALRPGAPHPATREPPAQSMEVALREQIWSGLGPNATPNQTGPHRPIQRPPPPPSSTPRVGATSSGGSSPSAPSSARPRVPAPAPVPASAREGMPLGYVVASAFFLAIAVAGFGLWLVLDVIAL